MLKQKSRAEPQCETKLYAYALEAEVLLANQNYGKMTGEFAEKYSEYYSSYYSRTPRKCQNPLCGHTPIYWVFVVRDPVSGDVKEIGSHCFQRLRQSQGLATEPWFNEYLQNLELEGIRREGKAVTPLIEREIREKTKQEWFKKAERKKRQEAFKEYVDSLKRQGISGEEYRKRIVEWNKQYKKRIT